MKKHSVSNHSINYTSVVDLILILPKNRPNTVSAMHVYVSIYVKKRT